MSSGNIFPAALPPHTVGPYAVQNAKMLKKVSLLIVYYTVSQQVWNQLPNYVHKKKCISLQKIAFLAFFVELQEMTMDFSATFLQFQTNYWINN